MKDYDKELPVIVQDTDTAFMNQIESLEENIFLNEEKTESKYSKYGFQVIMHKGHNYTRGSHRIKDILKEDEFILYDNLTSKEASKISACYNEVHSIVTKRINGDFHGFFNLLNMGILGMDCSDEEYTPVEIWFGWYGLRASVHETAPDDAWRNMRLLMPASIVPKYLQFVKNVNDISREQITREAMYAVQRKYEEFMEVRKQKMLVAEETGEGI